ncbi:hypothetical protein CDD83_2272 [Cordyceps sp. RAO-2017]|nr:hypothetical protein CDD83_2272 [Cordyceps sp. RAO-2017]
MCTTCRRPRSVSTCRTGTPLAHPPSHCRPGSRPETRNHSAPSVFYLPHPHHNAPHPIPILSYRASSLRPLVPGPSHQQVQSALLSVVPAKASITISSSTLVSDHALPLTRLTTPEPRRHPEPPSSSSCLDASASSYVRATNILLPALRPLLLLSFPSSLHPVLLPARKPTLGRTYIPSPLRSVATAPPACPPLHSRRASNLPTTTHDFALSLMTTPDSPEPRDGQHQSHLSLCPDLALRIRPSTAE